MEHLLPVWRDTSEQPEDTHVMLLMDYDGTLTPIVASPELALLPRDTKRTLKALSGKSHFTLAIISGRALGDLRDKVSLGGIIYVGNHGLEIEGPEIAFVHPKAQELKPALRAIYARLRGAFRETGGILMEDKGLSLSVHYRGVEEDRIREVRNTFERIVREARESGKVKVTGGKKAYEVTPAVDWDKGKAVEFLIEEYGKRDDAGELLPVYLGDDLTDEDAFRAINAYRRGISVFVGGARGDTAARYFLESPSEVTRFLNLLLCESQRGCG